MAIFGGKFEESSRATERGKADVNDYSLTALQAQCRDYSGPMPSPEADRLSYRPLERSCARPRLVRETCGLLLPRCAFPDL